MKDAPIINIAIADAQPIVRKGILQLVREAGYNVVAEARNGKELVAFISMLSSPPDICLLDINLTNTDDYDSIKIILSQWPSVRTLAFTTYDTEYSRSEIIKSGAAGFINKNASTSEIANAINEAYCQHSYYSGKNLDGANSDSSPLEIKNVFTDKEVQFIKYCCTELTYKEIAHRMNVTLRSLDYFRENIFQKQKLKCRTGLVLFALRSGLAAL